MEALTNFNQNTQKKMIRKQRKTTREKKQSEREKQDRKPWRREKGKLTWRKKAEL